MTQRNDWQSPPLSTTTGTAAAPSALEVTTLGDILESTRADHGHAAPDTTTRPTLSGNTYSSPTNYVPPPVTVDTVAQFRAANRAAHRREQRKRALYSFVTIVALAGSLYGARLWLLHRSEDVQAAEQATNLPSSSALKSLADRLATTGRETSSKLSSVASVLPGHSGTKEKANPAESLATPGVTRTEGRAAEEPAVAPVENQPEETQVAVNHSAPLASSRQTAEDPGEEPMAMPLHVTEGPTTGTQPQILSSVVGQVPVKAAVLAPQVPKRLVPATLVYSVPAQYPAMARQVRTEGEVVVRLTVDPTGTVSDATALSGAPLLRAAALDAVRKWKYQPATLGDRPVASNETVKIDFHLK